MPGLERHILDHEILETNNLKTLVLVDSSDYMEEPDGPMLEITLPGYTKYFLTNYVARQVNVFNSNTIGLTTVLNQAELTILPDGVWTIKQKICPYGFTYIIKKHMRVAMLLDKVSDLYSKIKNGDISKEFENEIVKIYILIEAAKANVNKNCDEAVANYELANLLVDKHLNKFCKNC